MGFADSLLSAEEKKSHSSLETDGTSLALPRSLKANFSLRP
jgi:hypothetical protein